LQGLCGKVRGVVVLVQRKLITAWDLGDFRVAWLYLPIERSIAIEGCMAGACEACNQAQI